MANWLQRLETAWSRRNVGAVAPPPEDAGRMPVCIVTGGSEGIGRHLANEFAAGGHRLLLIARTQQTLEASAAELRREYGAEVHIAAIDLTSANALQQVQTALDVHQLYADILVNNAGFGLGGVFAAQDPGRIADLCRLNIETLTALTRAFLPAMLQRASGGVLNVGSIGGLFPGPSQAAYYASKAYVLSFTEAIAEECAGSGVRISVAVPGPVATRFHERMGAAGAFYLQLQQVMTPDRVARIVYSGFIGRRTVIVPGFLASLNSFAVRYLPHVILVPFIGWFLKRRY